MARLDKGNNGWIVGTWRSDFAWERKCSGLRWQREVRECWLSSSLARCSLATLF